MVSYQVNPPNLFSSADGDLLPGWNIEEVHTIDSVPASQPAPRRPVYSGRGGMGHAACIWAGPGEGISFWSGRTKCCSEYHIITVLDLYRRCHYVRCSSDRRQPRRYKHNVSISGPKSSRSYHSILWLDQLFDISSNIAI